jgi:hypothetical protein
VAFSVEPSHSPSVVFTSSVVIPNTTTCVPSAVSIPSSNITARHMSSSRRPISSESAVRVHSMYNSDAVHFDAERESSSTSSPTRSPPEAHLRVDTLTSIRFITTTVGGSRSAKDW